MFFKTSCLQGREFFSLLRIFVDVQHLIKSAPIVIVPNQPPLCLSLLSLWGRILHQAVGQLVSVCNSKAEKGPEGNGNFVFSAFCMCLYEWGGEGAAQRKKVVIDGCLALR